MTLKEWPSIPTKNMARAFRICFSGGEEEVQVMRLTGHVDEAETVGLPLLESNGGIVSDGRAIEDVGTIG